MFCSTKWSAIKKRNNNKNNIMGFLIPEIDFRLNKYTVSIRAQKSLLMLFFDFSSITLCECEKWSAEKKEKKRKLLQHSIQNLLISIESQNLYRYKIL